MARYIPNAGFLYVPSGFMNRSFGTSFRGNGVRVTRPGRSGSGRVVNGSKIMYWLCPAGVLAEAPVDNWRRSEKSPSSSFRLAGTVELPARRPGAESLDIEYLAKNNLL